ncbi:type VII secretion protein EssA [Metabacillus sp. KIGAM252]|uniref:Type VII secretion protein EssA n=1 Tax=Metabacillus flavus TaxID=2823519 RepID=A0ABS5LKB5_9BACI|nr:type VII secretion protein EssA [Metabacillus flavus]MBS2970804.1 type VII secretion protein EssA [Metabacillus flavus]
MNQTNKMRKRAIILTALLLLIPATAVRAEEQLPEQPADIEDLAPNIYEEEKIKQQTDYFQEDKLYDRKYNVPDEIKNLQYEKPDPNRKEKELAELFATYTSNEIEANNTAAQIAKDKLFMDSDEKLFQSTGPQQLQADTQAESQGSSLTILYIALIGIGLLLILVILIPKLTAVKKEEL